MQKTLILAINTVIILTLAGCFLSSQLRNPPMYYKTKFDFYKLPSDEKMISTTYTSFVTRKEKSGTYFLRKFYDTVLVAEAHYLDRDLAFKNGSYKEFNLYDGKLSLEKEYVRNKIEGDEIFYYDDGSIRQIVNYKKGKKEGKTISYYKSGAVYIEYFYKKDIEVGPRIQYHKNGTKKMLINIDPKNHKPFIRKNNMGTDVNFGNFELFDSLGNKICEGAYINNKLENSDCNMATVVEQGLDPSILKMPQYPGGDEAMLKYLYSNIKYPAIAKKNNVQGLLVLSFVVNEDGINTDIKILRGIDPSLAEEALRVVMLMPDWIPGKVNEKPVKVNYKLPVRFKLE